MGKKRFQVSMSEEYFEKLEQMSNDYGLTLNSCAAFIICQYIDENKKKHDLMSGMVDELLSTPSDVLNNPAMLEMVKEILSNDKEFKTSVKETFEKGDE